MAKEYSHVLLPPVRQEIRLLTQYLPGDMDKISHPPSRVDWVTQDAISAHQLLRWVKAYRALVQTGLNLQGEADLEVWKTMARMFLDASDRVIV